MRKWEVSLQQDALQNSYEVKELEVQLTKSEYESLKKAEEVQLYLGIDERMISLMPKQKLDEWDIADDEREAVRKAQLGLGAHSESAKESLPEDWKVVSATRSAKLELRLLSLSLLIRFWKLVNSARVSALEGGKRRDCSELETRCSQQRLQCLGY